ILRRAKKFKGVVSVTKAKPGLASVQTREAASGGIIIDDLGYDLKITTLTQVAPLITHKR
uniref:Uncharacterized protein n=1 Tax=Panthera leo TaxID=9689 RepID=A0A8C8WA98_PANLE